MTTSGELKACPFCGGAARLLRHFNHGILGIDEIKYEWVGACEDCRAQHGPHPNRAEAAFAWNRRVPTPTLESRDEGPQG